MGTGGPSPGVKYGEGVTLTTHMHEISSDDIYMAYESGYSISGLNFTHDCSTRGFTFNTAYYIMVPRKLLWRTT
jgi:hypothetical protein